MLKGKEELSNYIQQKCIKQIREKAKIQEQIKILNKTKKIPIDISFDILTLKTPPASQSVFIMYCLLEVLDKDKIGMFFTDKEIEAFSSSEYIQDTIEFPMVLSDVIQIDDTHYIGKITCKELIKLRDVQLINYNENTQRVMESKIVDDNVIYQISINWKQVKDIEDAILNNRFIPNTLTFNISPNTKYRYNNTKKELTIISECEFDIIDGYHRYLAISDIFNKYGEIDLTMEMRICFFQQPKAQQFIWQEDQKTQMKKIISDTFNQTNNGNKICSYLNETGMYMGMISVGGLIDAAVLARAINVIFYHNKTVSMSDVIKDQQLIKGKLDKYIEKYTDCLDRKWSREEIILFTLFANDELKLDDVSVLLPRIKLYYTDFKYTHINKLRKEAQNVLQS